jgi:hypothetical protein
MSRAKYALLRRRGHSHGRALRSVADRLLNVAPAMLRAGTTFNPPWHPNRLLNGGESPTYLPPSSARLRAAALPQRLLVKTIQTPTY